MVSALSTSNLSIIVFSVSIPTATFVALFIYNFLLERRSRPTEGIKSTLRRIAKTSLIPSIILAGITIGFWLGMFGWSLAKTVYGDHQSLVAASARLSREIVELHRENAALRSEIDKLKSVRVPRIASVAVAPPKVTPSQSPAVPEVESVRLFENDEASTHVDAPYAKRITLQSNLPVNPVRFAVVCESPLKYAEVAKMEEGSIWYGAEEIYAKDPRIFVINMDSKGKPLLRPDAPLSFHLYSAYPIVITKFEQGPRQ